MALNPQIVPPYTQYHIHMKYVGRTAESRCVRQLCQKMKMNFSRAVPVDLLEHLEVYKSAIFPVTIDNMKMKVLSNDIVLQL